MRRMRLQEVKCLPTVILTGSSGVRNQIQVSQDCQICAVPLSPHHRVYVWHLQSCVPRPNGDMGPLITALQRLHPGGILFLGFSCHDLTSNDGGATLLAKCCLPILGTSLRATLGHPPPAPCDPGHPPTLSWESVLCVWGTSRSLGTSDWDKPGGRGGGRGQRQSYTGRGWSYRTSEASGRALDSFLVWWKVTARLWVTCICKGSHWFIHGEGLPKWH